MRPSSAPWEVLLVDNASTDETVAVARSCWIDGPAPLRVISEAKLGTRYARERGFAEAWYPLIGFVDDGNWVAPGWVGAALELMMADPGLGAVSRISEAVSDSPLPEWLDRYAAR
jgi:glycosyltransferase involved in cell wall biosynthesis